MTEFKKGFWNLAELEVQEWIKTDTPGFMTGDVKACRDKLIDAVKTVFDKDLEVDVMNEKFFQDVVTIDEILIAMINRIFGDL